MTWIFAFRLTHVVLLYMPTFKENLKCVLLVCMFSPPPILCDYRLQTHCSLLEFVGAFFRLPQIIIPHISLSLFLYRETIVPWHYLCIELTYNISNNYAFLILNGLEKKLYMLLCLAFGRLRTHATWMFRALLLKLNYVLHYDICLELLPCFLNCNALSLMGIWNYLYFPWSLNLKFSCTARSILLYVVPCIRFIMVVCYPMCLLSW